MKTIETVAYDFNELSDKAKEKARQWWRESDYDSGQIAFDDTVEDARNVGLKITELETCRSTSDKGEFIDGAFNCANAIIAQHGEACATYKTAKAFLAALDALPVVNSEEARTDDADGAEYEFLRALLKDYRKMSQAQYEEMQSDAYIDETIEANEYTFTAEGKRFG